MICVRVFNPPFTASSDASISFSGSTHCHLRPIHSTRVNFSNFLAGKFIFPFSIAISIHATYTFSSSCSTTSACTRFQVSRSSSNQLRIEE